MAANPNYYAAPQSTAPQTTAPHGNGKREVHFHLPAGGISRHQLENLKNLLARHRGESSAFIHLKDAAKGETILVLPEGLKVNPSTNLIQEVDQLFGSPVTIFH
jgi:hypothetical protein